MRLKDGHSYAGRYRIARKLGDGAMGAVYEAEDLLVRRRVALNVLHPHIAERRGALHRFELEAQAASRVGSRHIVEILDVGELQGDTRFLVMELLEGISLAQRIRDEGRLEPAEAARPVLQLLDGLDAAHAAGLVHRDLKPSNVFLTATPVTMGGAPPYPPGASELVKILDFGVSQFAAAGDDLGTTGVGSVLGTPFYMSPEQARGSRNVDHRSDLYAVGVILYECVTGKVPFAARTFNELIFRIVLEAPVPVESIVPDLDPGFVAIIHRAMARDVNERFQSAREMRDALACWLSVDHAPAGIDTANAMHWAGAPRRTRSSSERSLVLGLLAALALGGAMLLAVRPDVSIAAPPRVAAAPATLGGDPCPPARPVGFAGIGAPASAMRPPAPGVPAAAPLPPPPASATPCAIASSTFVTGADARARIAWPRHNPAAVSAPTQPSAL